MRIFVTNDDGIEANGIHALVDLMKEYGEVSVVAPDKPMSGVGHAITMRTPIVVKESDQFNDITALACSGTPADCVKFGMGHLFGDKPPDLLVSGINHGSNASVNMLYSGTVAGAVEGCLYGVPSIAFSSLDHDEESDLTVSLKVAKEVMELIQNNPLPHSVLLNVNIPVVEENEFRGIRLSRQSMAHWKEEFMEEAGLNGKKAYWLNGQFICDDKDKDTDIWALENNYASVVPVYLDLTAHAFLKKLKQKTQ